MNILRVAKGVGGFIAGSDVGRSDSQRVEALLQRISDGALPEERQDAVAELRDVLQSNPEAQQAVGSGFPVLLNALKTERGDQEMTRGILESLALAVQPNERSSRWQGADPAAINAELLAKNDEVVPLLLAFLKDGPQAASNFYVRYHTVQLLTALAAGGPYRLQKAILAAPMGVVQLMDLLGDSHEVVRNEAVLLLMSLTKSSPDIQKIAAFEGAFEHILKILKEEDWVMGGIIVQDCLDLLSHLLQNNIGNQLMFREVGHLSAFVKVLQLPADRYRRSLPKQVGINLAAAMSTTQLLSTPAAPSSGGQEKQQQECALANKAALVKLGILESLLALAVGSGGIPSCPVRTQALACIAKLIKGVPPHQAKLGDAKVTAASSASTPALQAILQVALSANDPAEATAAAGVIAGFCEEYREGQQMLAATFTPPTELSTPQQGGIEGTFGSQLAASLTGLRPSPMARAAGLLHHVVLNNAASKQAVLQASSAGAREGSLLVRCCRQLANMLASGQQGEPPVSLAVMMLLRLLITWAHDCAPALEALLAPPGHLPMLLELAQKRFGERTAIVNGLAAALLGVCAMELSQPITCLSSDPSASPERIAGNTVLEIIGSRIGMASYFSRIDALLQRPEFAQAPGKTPGTDNTAPSKGEQGTGTVGALAAPSIFDAAYVRWLSQLKDRMHKLAMSGLRRPSGEGLPAANGDSAEQPQDDQGTITALQREIDALKTQLRRAHEEKELRSKQQSNPAHEQELQTARAHAQQAAAASAQHVKELTALKGQLQQAEQEAVRWRSAANQAQATAAKLEADMEGLGTAYNMLETHSHEVEARLQELESTGVSSSKGKGAEDGKTAAEDDEEDSSGLDDLLVCLGQEEQKVAILRARLEDLGVDVDELLEAIGDREDDPPDA